MKPGGEIKCPSCGADAFLVKKPVMDGWTKTGDILACSACSAKIADIPPETAAKPAGGTADAAALDKLARFLGADREAPRTIAVSDSEKRFCKDCSHLIPHPFINRCSLLQKNVDPMGDCPRFSKARP